MTFTIINNKINSGLQMVSKVVNTKNALPILSDIIFIVEGETLILKASDSENTLITKMELASADGDGEDGGRVQRPGHEHRLQGCLGD